MTKSVFITGASRGIGAAIAEEFAKNDYSLYLVCQKSADRLNELARRLNRQYGAKCRCFLGDVADFSFIQSCFREIQSLDVLINNAGVSYVGLLSEMNPADFDRVLSVNLSAAFYTAKCAIPFMLQKKQGRILNISSVWGNCGASMEVAYSASKGGLNSFTKALAKELAPSNIQVNALACGLIDTDMNRCFSDEDLKKVIEEIPADRMGDPAEVARIAFQLANAPSYLTGQIISVDGGWQ